MKVGLPLQPTILARANHNDDVLFFEKRNQKTFAPALGCLSHSSASPCAAPNRQTFLVLFFKITHPSVHVAGC
jgi:hypothetical protein